MHRPPPQYNAGSVSASKWEFIGGAAQRADDNGNTRTTSSNVAQTTGSPTLTLARAGDYEVVYGDARSYSNSASANDIRLQLFLDASLKHQQFVLTAAVTTGGPNSNPFPLTGVTAGQVLQVRYLSNASLSSSFDSMFLRAIPVRIA